VNPVLLYALQVPAPTEIYKGGRHPGDRHDGLRNGNCPEVRKIVGPGGPYVTAAKRQVYGAVALDLVAGPSEIRRAGRCRRRPAARAADLLSQAEHGTGLEKALLVTPSMKLAAAVAKELERQTATLSRQRGDPPGHEARHVDRGGAEHGAMASISAIGLRRKHLDSWWRQPEAWLKSVRAPAGAVSGALVAESAAISPRAPSHVLPTGGAAAMFSG